MKQAFLGTPGYGEFTAGSARGHWRSTEGPNAKTPLDVYVAYSSGSLLAQNFNALWCGALNRDKAGERVDYFAMLHTDVEPEDFWLDKLIEELEDKKLDVLSAVIPIKDPHGLTSTALAHPDGNPFRVLCRITMKEAFALPETFTSEDVGHPLLLNTGCWVCKFDPAWRTKVYFTINDRIVFDKNMGIYRAEAEPEDWFFSRLCHELKLKIGATRKVSLDHTGKARYRNYEPWGDSFDQYYATKSAIEIKPDNDGWKFPYDVDGWLLREEGRALADLARGKQVLEIGSYCGRSTICMAQTADKVVALDPFDGRATPNSRDTLHEFTSNIGRYGLANRVSAIRGTIEQLRDAIKGEVARRFDMIFIDGDHRAEFVRKDIALSLPMLKENGLLVFHDYREAPGSYDGRWDPGVTEAVNELVANGGEIISRHSTVAVVKPPTL